MGKKKSVTILDVAREAGVAVSTVSKSMRDSKLISTKTKQRVEQAIVKLNYQRRSSNRQKDSRFVGVILPDILNPFSSMLLNGITDVGQLHDYRILFANSHNDPKNDLIHLESFLDVDVGGIIIDPSMTSDSSPEHFLSPILRRNIPVVFLDRVLDSAEVNSVTSNNEEGAYQAITYLLKLGHRDIIYVAGPKNFSTEKARFRGVLRALAEERLHIGSERIIEGQYSHEKAYAEVKRILLAKIPVTAMFCSADIMALGAKAAIEDCGLRVPDDISLVGYGDIFFSGSMALTTISLPAYEMGRNAFLLFEDLASGRVKSQQQQVLNPSMIIRKTCRRI